MIEIRIQGMTCEHCVAAVRDALTELPGVTQVVSVDLGAGRALVEGEVTRQALVEAVTAAGYRVDSESAAR